MSMNPDIKAKWVAALRSGEYEQGKSYLVQDVWSEDDESNVSAAYCCLGVLQKLSQDDPATFGVVLRDEMGENSMLDLGDALELGLNSDDLNRLACMNDGQSWAGPNGIERYDEHTFTQIADYIEENL